MMKPLRAGDTFRFDCHPGVPCFNECCRDLDQFLMPYDILRLRRALALDSHAFLERFCRLHVGPRSGLPVVTLAPADPVRLACPFVTPRGCRVYDDRPASCRTYPLVRVLSRSRATGRTEASYLLLKEPHCRGFEQAARRNLSEWIDDQAIAPYNRFNDPLLDIISLKNRRHPGALAADALRLFRLACYDLDAFRRAIGEDRLPGGIAPGGELRRAAGSDDENLLMAGYRFLEKELFDREEPG